MKILTHNIIILAVPLIALFAFAGTASAQAIEVAFEATPLFADVNFLPGDAVTRTFTVENLDSGAKEVRLRTINENDGGLAGALTFVVTEDSGTEYYDGTLLALFGMDFVDLGTLPPGASETYSIQATFAPASGNEFQENTVGFDLCVGFAGNENCVTDTDTPGNGDDDDEDSDGGGNGSDDDGDDTPPGRVAGDSAENDNFSFPSDVIDSAGNFLRGMVLGESTTTEEEESEPSEPLAEVAGIDRSSSPVAALFTETNCIFWWLLLLAAISFSWSLYEDKYRNGDSVFADLFARNALFTGAYVFGLLLCFFIGILDAIWWLFAGAWIAATMFDYRAHRMLFAAWNAAQRNAYYTATGVFLILTSFVFGFPCEWWPFFLIAVVSVLLFFFDTE